MKKNVAYHEAGHVIAHWITGIPFKFVTIKAEDCEDGSVTVGHVKCEDPKSPDEYLTYPLYDPIEFNNCFLEDFCTIAGFVTEKIFKGRFNHKGVSGDYSKLINNRLINLPEKLSLKYQAFLIEYTYTVLTMKTNWSMIEWIASALIERETLCYREVRDIIRQNFNLFQNKQD